MSESSNKITPAPGADSPHTLERLLAHYARKSPDKTALVDPPNRSELEASPEPYFAGSYDYAGLEFAVERLSRRFLAMGLEAGDYVGVQMPNFSDTVIAVLALMRARLVPCMMPIAWGIGEVDRSCERLKFRALISCGRFEDTDHSEIMRELAFRHLNVRFVFGFSDGPLAEGIENLTVLLGVDDAPINGEPGPVAGVEELALVTYLDPATPVPHSHGELLAAGLMHVSETGLSADDQLLSAYPLSTVTGLVANLSAWLISGCQLVLHHPFNLAVLQEQLRQLPSACFMAPRELADWVLDTPDLRPARLGYVWRGETPDIGTLHASAPTDTVIVDCWNLGDLAVLTKQRRLAAPAPLFEQGRLCLHNHSDKLCIAGGKISKERLFVKGRIFPSCQLLDSGVEWFSIKKRFAGDWLDTGLTAFEGAGDTIQPGQPLKLDVSMLAVS